MRTIAVEPTRLEACAGQIEQLRQEVERTVARLYERVELMDTADGSFMTSKEAGHLMLHGSTLLVGRK